LVLTVTDALITAGIDRAREAQRQEVRLTENALKLVYENRELIGKAAKGAWEGLGRVANGAAEKVGDGTRRTELANVRIHGCARDARGRPLGRRTLQFVVNGIHSSWILTDASGNFEYFAVPGTLNEIRLYTGTLSTPGVCRYNQQLYPNRDLKIDDPVFVNPN
jgi:hypothetical protein